MTIRYPVLAGLAAVLAAGCSTNPGTKPDTVPVKGVVQKAGGKPVANVTIDFIPTASDQNQVGAQLKADGKFDVKLIPGTYRYAFEGHPAALKTVPARYHSVSEAVTVEVPSGGKPDLTIKLEG